MEKTAPDAAPAALPDRADPMPWRRARGFLEAAGWRIGTDAGGALRISAVDGPALPVPVAAPPDEDDAEIDGHALLRAAGGGRLDVALADSVSAETPADEVLVDEVLVGLNWSFVRAGPFAGIARSPGRGTEGARTARQGAPIAGRPLAALAGWLCSLDPLRRSIGLAAVNAFWNRPDRPPAPKPWGLARFQPPGDGLVIVGGFRGAAGRLPGARVIEQEPKGTDIPADAAGPALAEAKAIAITAQTLMNGSLEPLLARIGHVAERLLVGPSAPVAPPVLAAGVSRVAGLAVTDPDAAAAFIKETGAMIAMDAITRELEIAL